MCRETKYESNSNFQTQILFCCLKPTLLPAWICDVSWGNEASIVAFLLYMIYLGRHRIICYGKDNNRSKFTPMKKAGVRMVLDAFGSGILIPRSGSWDWILDILCDLPKFWSPPSPFVDSHGTMHSVPSASH